MRVRSYRLSLFVHSIPTHSSVVGSREVKEYTVHDVVGWLCNCGFVYFVVCGVDALVKDEVVYDGYGGTEWVVFVDLMYKDCEKTFDCDNMVFVTFCLSESGVGLSKG